MTRVRSPGYPSVTLAEAIALTRKIHERDRNYPIAREVAAQHMGFTGLTGHSAKILASVIQYGLLEKTAKSEIRVTARAVEILHPESEEGRNSALQEAAFFPPLFQQLRERFPGGIPSEGSLKSFLVKQDFSDVAMAPAIRAYLETYEYVRQGGANESHSLQNGKEAESAQHQNEKRADPMQTATQRPMAETPKTHNDTKHKGERDVLAEEISPDKTVKIAVTGDLDEDALAAIEDFVKRQRLRIKRNNVPPQDPEPVT